MIFSGTMRRASDTAGTPPVAILNSRRPMRLRASRPRWSVSEESCATGFREAGSISHLSNWNMDRMARKGAAPKGGPSLGGNAQGGQQAPIRNARCCSAQLNAASHKIQVVGCKGAMRARLEPVTANHLDRDRGEP